MARCVDKADSVRGVFEERATRLLRLEDSRFSFLTKVIANAALVGRADTTVVVFFSRKAR